MRYSYGSAAYPLDHQPNWNRSFELTSGSPAGGILFLHCQRSPGNDYILFLGQMAIQDERGMLKLSSDWLLRLRYNPFYSFLENQVLEGIDEARGPQALSDTKSTGGN